MTPLWSFGRRSPNDQEEVPPPTPRLYLPTLSAVHAQRGGAVDGAKRVPLFVLPFALRGLTLLLSESHMPRMCDVPGLECMAHEAWHVSGPGYVFQLGRHYGGRKLAHPAMGQGKGA